MTPTLLLVAQLTACSETPPGLLPAALPSPKSTTETQAVDWTDLPWPSTLWLFGHDVVAGDFDGDGFDELVIGHNRQTEDPDGVFYWLPGSEDGLMVSDAERFAPQAPELNGGFATDFCPPADYSGDGLEDLVVLGRAGTAEVLLGSDAGLVRPETLLELPSADGALRGRCVSLGDLDLDGAGDFAIAFTEDGSSDITVYYGDSETPGTRNETPAELSVGIEDVWSLTAGDFNGDGWVDLARTSESYGGSVTLLVFYGDELGGFFEAEELSDPTYQSWSRFGSPLRSADLNGDGYADLIAGAPGYEERDEVRRGAVVILWGSATGLITSSSQWISPPAGEQRATYFGQDLVVVESLDGDSLPDLAIGTSYHDDGIGRVWTYSGGDWSEPSSTWVGTEDKQYPEFLFAGGDFDGDGGGDFVVESDGTLTVHWSACADHDSDGLCVEVDCDDTDPEVSDEGQTFYLDDDRDGFGDPESSKEACELPDGYADNDLDCDDSASETSPGAAEICDEADNDCDGSTDEDPVDGREYGVDSDGDGYTTGSIQACEEPGGDWVPASEEDDCDDSDASVHPQASEVAGDGVDNDCAGGDQDLDDLSNAADITGETGGFSCSTGRKPGSWGWMLVLAGVLIGLRRRSS